MSAFENVRPIQPVCTLPVPPTAFATDWAHRPTAAIAVGLRLLSEEDAEHATREAAKSTVAFLHLGDPEAPEYSEDTREEVYSARIMAYAVARAVCDPNDVRKPHDALPALEDFVLKYFTSDGIRLLFERLQLETAKASPCSPAANDDEIALLIAHLKAKSLTKIPRAEMLAVRRLLGCALESLRHVAPRLAPDEEDEEPVDYEIQVRS